MKKRKYIILGIVTVLLVAVTVVLAYRMQQEKKKEADYDEYTGGNQERNYITYKGEKYKYNYDLRTVLFMGIDEENEIEERKVGDGGQTDSLVLFAMDTENKSAFHFQGHNDGHQNV